MLWLVLLIDNRYSQKAKKILKEYKLKPFKIVEVDLRGINIDRVWGKEREREKEGEVFENDEPQ